MYSTYLLHKKMNVINDNSAKSRHKGDLRITNIVSFLSWGRIVNLHLVNTVRGPLGE